MTEKPTFEQLVGSDDVSSWNNDATDNELSVVSDLANKQLKLSAELFELETSVKAKKFPVAMAEKRAMSRVVLKIAGFYEQGVFGQDEMVD